MGYGSIIDHSCSFYGLFAVPSKKHIMMHQDFLVVSRGVNIDLTDLITIITLSPSTNIFQYSWVSRQDLEGSREGSLCKF
jgi:hypothetical protein